MSATATMATTGAARPDIGRRGEACRIGAPLPAREAARALAELFRMLAVGFSYPEADLVESTRRQIGIARVACAQALLPMRLRGRLKAAAHHWQSLAVDDLRGDYSRLFLGTALVPLREGGYGDGMRFAGQPVDLSDLNGFYLAFGFGPPAEEACPPDHLGVELEFASLLYLKIAYALQQRQTGQARITQAALASFIEDHLGRWTGSFCAALNRAGAPPAYVSLAGVLSRTIGHECNRLGIRPPPAEQGTRPDPVSADTLTCPLEQALRPPEFPESEGVWSP